MTALVVLLGVVVGLLAVLVAGLLRSHAEILRRLQAIDGGGDDADTTGADTTRVGQISIDGPSPALRARRRDGRRVPDISGATPDGGAMLVTVGTGAVDTVVAFLSTTCATCATFWSELAAASLTPSGAISGATPSGVLGGARLVVVTHDPGEEDPRLVAELAGPGMAVVMSSQAWDDFEVPGSPYVVHVDGVTGTVTGEGTGLSWDQVSRLLAQASGDGRRASGESREARMDEDLRAAGILPGDPRLYPTGLPADGGAS